KADKEPIARQFRREIGGTSANLAVTLSRLGFKASAVGGVGDDKLGAALEVQLAAEGVDTSGIVRVDAPTGLTFVTPSATGEASFVPYRGADLRLTGDDVTTAMGKARFGVVSSTGMLPSLRAATEKFISVVEKAKGAVMVDLNVRAHLWPDAEAMRAAV